MENDEKNPVDITSGTNKKVWWKCGMGHEWFAAVGNRAVGHGCPVCNHRKKKKD